jgi:uncharacterized protein (DUF1778 family)
MKPSTPSDVNDDESDTGKTAVLRARCDKELKALIRRASRISGLKQTDLIRIGAKRFAASLIYQPNMGGANPAF